MLVLLALLLAPADSTEFAVTVDSAAGEVVVALGPYDLPSAGGHTGADSPLYDFRWPVEGWLRGYEISLADRAGRPVPRSALHHLIVVNFERRQLVYPAAERLLGVGAETGDFMLPPTVGVPLARGSRLGLYVAWHNGTGAPLDGVHLTLRLRYAPANQVPAPVAVLPVYFDANLTIGGGNTFDLPPGPSERTFEFVLPVGGRLLGTGGHLHDYGTMVRLEDADTGERLVALRARVDGAGRIEGVERRLFGVTGRGLRLHAGRRYRIVGAYDNRTGQLLSGAGMAHMVGLYAPDDAAAWPQADPDDPLYARDLESLEVRRPTRESGVTLPSAEASSGHPGHRH